jgi:BASS family bile acid:Na+ symporter
MLAVISGMLIHQGALWTRHLVLALLFVIITLSIMAIDGHIFKTPRSMILPAFLGILMNYAILGNLIILMSAFLIHDESTWIGFVTLAAVPSAVAIIPLTRILNGNTSYAVIGTIGVYIGALVIMPLIVLGLLDIHSLDKTKLTTITIVLTALPIAVSRILVRTGLNNHINPFKGQIMNWSFFLITYTLTGVNRETIMTQPLSLVPMAVIAFLSTFFLGFLIQWTGGLFHVNKSNLTALFLLGTLKNCGLAGGLALYLFSREAALPAVVLTVFMTIYMTWLDFKTQ